MYKKDKILVLGSGLVSKPGVIYLLDKGLNVTVTDIVLSRAEELVENYDNGVAASFDINDNKVLESYIKKHDIIISLLPWVFHAKVAKLCLENNKDMATASYVSEEMAALGEEAEKKGLLFLNEIGVDPGIDHMSAQKIIDDVHEEGGKIEHFYSYCGGLPAPDDNDNPFGYKFSWSPKGVVLASRNPAKFLENGKIIDIEGKELFAEKTVESEIVEGVGDLEVYPNRDSLPYIDIYGIEEAQTVKRGTYRNIGWCETFLKIIELGLVDETKKDSIKGSNFYNVISEMISSKENEDLKEKLANKLNIEIDSKIIQKFEWLGLFDKDKILKKDNLLDNLSDILQEKLFYKDGEKDMLVMRHKFIIINKDGTRDKITSTLIDYGIPFKDTSMARTVSLPLAIGVRLMAEGKIALKGVKRPVYKEIYEPVLKELEKLDIKMVETRVRE